MSGGSTYIIIVMLQIQQFIKIGNVSIRNGPGSHGRRQHGPDDGRVCAELPWGTDGTWLHYGKKVQMVKSVWRFVQHLAGKPWVLSPMWTLLWHVAATEALLQLTGSCSWTWYSLMAVGSFRKSNAPCSRAKVVHKMAFSTTTNLRCLQFPQISIQLGLGLTLLCDVSKIYASLMHGGHLEAVMLWFCLLT